MANFATRTGAAALLKNEGKISCALREARCDSSLSNRKTAKWSTASTEQRKSTIDLKIGTRAPIMIIPFSRQELRRAWQEAYAASQKITRSNAHRLLLFYSAECGLKAAWLKRQNKEILDEQIMDATATHSVSHDLNKVLDLLRAGQEQRLPPNLRLPDLRNTAGTQLSRHCSSGQINQAWRYGGKLEAPNTDQKIEVALESLYQWLKGELR
jgi:hypothetical protein